MFAWRWFGWDEIHKMHYGLLACMDGGYIRYYEFYVPPIFGLFDSRTSDLYSKRNDMYHSTVLQDSMV